MQITGELPISILLTVGSGALTALLSVRVLLAEMRMQIKQHGDELSRAKERLDAQDERIERGGRAIAVLEDRERRGLR